MDKNSRCSNQVILATVLYLACCMSSKPLRKPIRSCLPQRRSTQAIKKGVSINNCNVEVINNGVTEKISNFVRVEDKEFDRFIKYIISAMRTAVVCQISYRLGYRQP
jgi:hypothetical protein